MKTLILTTLALTASIALVNAQGTISILSTAPTVYTNNGAFSGPATGPSGTYMFEVLDMTQGAWAALTPAQQAGASDLFDNPTDLSLWTDSGVSGINSTLHAGGINAVISVAANWAAPTSDAGYNTAPSYDYYTIVGWSANLGSWSTLSNEIENYDIPFYAGALGQTGVAYNYAGGLDLAPVNLWGASPTGLAGSGGLPTTDGLTLYIMPEPTTLALVGLGGLSMILLRRRKS